MIKALCVALLAGFATFFVQNDLFPARLHAAPFVVPRDADWRQEMIDRFPGGGKVDHVVAKLSNRLDLSAAQASKARAILEWHHERMLALLVASPPSMTRAQFQLQEQQLFAETRAKLNAILTPDQQELLLEFGRPA